MIICHKPCIIYDVDVIALTALAAIGLAACFGVIIPATADAGRYQEFAARITAAKAKTQETSDRLKEVGTAIAALQRGVEEQTAAAPRPGAFTGFLRRVANLAQESGLQIVQVVPQPAQRAEGYRHATVRYTATGRSLDFARFLDNLSRENPYFALRDFSLQTASTSDTHDCKVTWTLQLYMLEEDPPSRPGGQG